MQNGISNPHLAKPKESSWVLKNVIRLQGKGVFNMNTKTKLKLVGMGLTLAKGSKLLM